MKSRSRGWTCIVIGVCVVLASLFWPVAATAATVAGADYGLGLARQVLASPSPQKAYAALSTAQRAAVDRATRPVTAAVASETGKMPTLTNVAASAGCWSAYAYFDWNAAAGNTVYTTWQGLHWCSNGSSITSYYVYDRGGETSTPGWSYQGHGISGSWNVGWETRSYTQEKFTFGIGAYGYSTSPCTQVRGGATGLYSSRASCNLS